jgi:hypothetical protein
LSGPGSQGDPGTQENPYYVWVDRPNISSDNGTELTSVAILRWSQQTGVEWHYIAPGKP